MIIWKGLGILSVVIPFGAAILFQLIFGDSSMYSGIGYIIGGILTGFIGKRLNTDNERMVTDPETGRQALQKIEHSMFWIKMELWAPIFMLLGGSFVLSNITNGKSEDLAFPLIAIVVIIIGACSFYNDRKKSDSVFSAPSSSLFSTGNEKNNNNQSTIKKSTIVKVKSQRKTTLTEEEKRKKQFFDELRNSSNSISEYESTDHSKYMPKKNDIQNE